MYRLNDMWTISLQDREHACWEEASITIDNEDLTQSEMLRHTVCVC